MANVNVILAGRTDVNDFFDQSGVFESERLNHTPFLVFLIEEDAVTVRVVEKSSELLTYPDNTPVMAQWRGEWRSDFFQFTVGQYRQYIESKNQLLKSVKNVVKIVGPHGGFRALSYEYVNAEGVTLHTSTSARTEAERLEAFFTQNNIPITIQKVR